MSFGDRLKKLRLENDLTMDEFVEAFNRKYPEIDIKKSMVSRYENNLNKPKQFVIVESIAGFFGVHINYMTGRSEDRYEGNLHYKKIPILGTIAAGIPIMAHEDILGHEYISPYENIDYCLKVKGDSMIGISQNYLSNLENGKFDIKLSLLFKIALELDIGLQELIEIL